MKPEAVQRTSIVSLCAVVAAPASEPCVAMSATARMNAKSRTRIAAFLPYRVQGMLQAARISFKYAAGETSESPGRFTRVSERLYPACRLEQAFTRRANRL